MDHTVTIADDVTVLSTDPNDLGQCPTVYDSLSERAATTLSYDLAGDANQTVSDVPLLDAAKLPPKSAMVLGVDHHGTSFVVGMVCSIKTEYVINRFLGSSNGTQF